MKKLLVRYKVKADRVVENENLVKEVYKQLHENKIDSFHYTTLKLEDGVSFIHIAAAGAAGNKIVRSIAKCSNILYAFIYG